MEQPSDKIQVPVKTKIVSVFAFISAIISSVTLILLVANGMDPVKNWPFFLAAAGYFYVAKSLLIGQKSGWYVGLAIFGIVIYFFFNAALRSLGPLEYVDLRKTYFSLAVINISFFALLLFAGRDYFAAIEKAKNK